MTDLDLNIEEMNMEQLDNMIDFLQRKISESIDSYYNKTNIDKRLPGDEHFQVWDTLYACKARRKALNGLAC